MKITPIEIRQHTFEKGLRGYKPEDVDAFLVSLSQEWDRVTGEYKMLKMQLELAEKELGKLKEVEMTLFRTLKTAEDTSAQITDQANKAAEQYMAETRQKADEVLADARKRSALMVQDAENQSRYLKDNILNDLKAMEHDFKALENYKESLAVQIRTLASNAVDSIDRFEKKFARQNLKGKIEDVTAQITSQSQQSPAAELSSDDQPTVDAPISSEPTDDHEHTSDGEQLAEAANPATELPPLMERETFVPEAIPTDDALVEKLDEAAQYTQHPAPASIQETTAEEEPVDEALADHSAHDNYHDNHRDPEEHSASATTETSEPAPIKKSGSFFDQI